MLPGYIDAHTHLTMDHDDNWEKAFYETTLRSVPEQAFHAGANARATLRAGVTTVRDVGSSDFIDVALRNAIKDGLTDGPTMFVVGHAIDRPVVTATARRCRPIACSRPARWKASATVRNPAAWPCASR